MKLTEGARIGPYEVVAPLGEGGMGEVWRARDTKLGRDVALKVLPPSFAEDPERLARFQREAQVLASLNHPCIGSIYGLEDAGGGPVLVLEIIEGPTLADRISQGPIPVMEAISLAAKIADALEYAHERGIVHRDLKPANVKMTPDGAVKVLDFGLAKAIAGEMAAGGPTSTPTMMATVTSAGTAAGLILGTAAYMSPEQARGKPVDRRADIWSFGCLLFELLTGKRLFEGETVSDTIAAVLTRDPHWGALPSNTPESTRRLLERCLDRDPKQRLRDAGEARIALENPGAAIPRSSTPSRSGRAWIPVTVAAIALLAGLGLARVIFPPSTTAERLARLTLEAPAGTAFEYAPVVSPDGTKIAFSARDADGQVRIYLRPLATFETVALAGTENASQLFWSPDSDSIGFCDATSLKTLDLSSGLVRSIASCSDSFRGGTWGSDGTILYAPSSNSAISAVPAAGGASKELTTLGENVPDYSHRFPAFLPDGKRFVFLGWSNAADAPEDALGLFVGDLGGGSVRRISAERSNAAIVENGNGTRLLFARQGTLLAVPFDTESLAIRGGEEILDTNVGSSEGSGYGAFSATRHGDLVTLPVAGIAASVPGWTDRTGSDQGEVSVPAIYSGFAFSPDGTRVAAEVVDQRRGWTDLWVIDLDREFSTRLTSGPFSRWRPVWRPDGKALGFTSEVTGRAQPYWIPNDGSARESVLVETPNRDTLGAWSPDGDWIVLVRVDAHAELWAHYLRSPREIPICQVDGDCDDPAISPDGRWIAFTSDVSGRSEIYVRSFPEPRGQVQISNGGGSRPHWRKDGGEILYRDPEGWVVAVDVSDAAGSRYGAPKRLFRMAPRTLIAPEPDHRRLLNAMREMGAGTSARVILGLR